MRGLVISFCWLFFGLGGTLAQTLELMGALEQEGLQNLRVMQEPGHVYLVYENNRFRYEAQAMAFVLEQLATYGSEMEGTERSEVHLLVLQRGVPMMVLHTGLEALVDLVDGSSSYADWVAQADFSFEVEQVHRKLKEAPRVNHAYRKVDLPLGVNFQYAMVGFVNPFASKINLQPELTSVLTKGLTFSAMYSIPVQNDLDIYNDPRMIILRMSQDLRLWDDTFVNLNLGYFTRNRKGFLGSAHQYFFDEALRLNMTYGFTDYGYIDTDLSPVFVDQNKEMYYGGFTYRNRKFHTDVDFRYGKFYLEDVGYRVSLIRQIDEIFIGFYIHKTEIGDDAGFEVQVPIGPRKHLKPMAVRPMVKEFFYLPYFYSGNGAAINYYAGENALLNIKEYYPSTLKRGLEKYLVRD